MFTYNEVWEAYKDCLRNKRNSPGAIEFMVNEVQGCRELTDEINSHTYSPGVSDTFIITDPKVREVFAASFRDRIVHHLVIGELMPYLENYFIPNSFSCMKGRGTLYGIKTMASLMSQCQPGWYVMKMDVKSFFMSIRKSLLAAGLEEFIEDRYQEDRKKQDLLYLCKVIVLHDPTKNCIRKGDQSLLKFLPPEKSLFFLPPDKGLPIGNLTSQVFANFYMTPLDLYITQTLGIKLYGRYVDDFTMYGPKDLLLSSAVGIRDFAKTTLDIEISPDKFYFQPYQHGVKFIGSQIMPGRVYCGNRVRGELEKKLYQTKPNGTPETVSSINSYLGLICHYSSYQIRKHLLSDWPEGWDLYLEPSEDYLKVKSLSMYEEN